MTAAERLQQLSGLTGATAAAMLLAIGSGVTTGEALADYSALPSATAAEHLLVDHIQQVVQAGGAHKSQVKFTPIREVEAPYEGFVAEVSTGWCTPFATASATFVVESTTCSVGETSNAKANGYVPVKGVGLVAGYGAATPYCDAYASVGGAALRGTTGTAHPEAMAAARVSTPEAYSGTGDTLPWGVRNPTDEELVSLVLQLTRSNVLTRKHRVGI